MIKLPQKFLRFEKTWEDHVPQKLPSQASGVPHAFLGGCACELTSGEDSGDDHHAAWQSPVAGLRAHAFGSVVP